jgi:hypothetical protein
MSANATTPPTDDVDFSEADILAALEIQATPEAAESPAEVIPAAEESAAEVPAAEVTPEPEAAAPEVDELAALKAQVAALTAQLAAPAAPAVPLPSDLRPLPSSAAPAPERPALSSMEPIAIHTSDAAELDARARTLSNLHAWTIRNEDGARLGETDLTRSQVLELRARTYETLYHEIPDRRAHLAAAARAEAEAITAYPGLKDANAELAKATAALLRSHPSLANDPAARLLAADAAAGRLARLGSKLPAPSSTAPSSAVRQQPPRAPASAARPGVIPPRSTPSSNALKSATDRARSGGGRLDDIASLIASQMSD